MKPPLRPLGSPTSMAVTGFVFGLAYFAALRQTAALFASGSGWLVPSALTFGRIATMTIVFTMAAKLGAMPLLAAFLGFLLARAVALRLGADRRKETNAKPKQGSALPGKVKRLQNRPKLRCESFARRRRSAMG